MFVKDCTGDEYRVLLGRKNMSGINWREIIIMWSAHLFLNEVFYSKPKSQEIRCLFLEEFSPLVKITTVVWPCRALFGHELNKFFFNPLFNQEVLTEMKDLFCKRDLEQAGNIFKHTVSDALR